MYQNTVDCGSGMCCFGIELGPHPWYQSDPIGGGFSVSENVVSGAGVGINVDAAGSASEYVVLDSNVITNSQDSFTCGALCGVERSGSDINVSPDSAVDSTSDNQATSTTTYACQ